MPWPGFEPGCLAALPPQDSVSTSFTTRAYQNLRGPTRGPTELLRPRITTSHYRLPSRTTAPSRQCVYQFHHQGGCRKVESALRGVNRCGASRRPALDWCPMGLWVAFAFGALIGVFLGALIGRARAARNTAAAPMAPPPPAQRFAPPEVQHVVLDEGSANVLNALNTRLAAIGALADLLHGSPLDPERARGRAGCRAADQPG